jgi:hypothetical protein
LLVTASAVPSSPILVTRMKEALRSSKTPVLTRAARRNIPEDAIVQVISCQEWAVMLRHVTRGVERWVPKNLGPELVDSAIANL